MIVSHVRDRPRSLPRQLRSACADRCRSAPQHSRPQQRPLQLREPGGPARDLSRRRGSRLDHRRRLLRQFRRAHRPRPRPRGAGRDRARIPAGRMRCCRSSSRSAATRRSAARSSTRRASRSSAATWRAWQSRWRAAASIRRCPTHPTIDKQAGFLSGNQILAPLRGILGSRTAHGVVASKSLARFACARQHRGLPVAYAHFAMCETGAVPLGWVLSPGAAARIEAYPEQCGNPRRSPHCRTALARRLGQHRLDIVAIAAKPSRS